MAVSGESHDIKHGRRGVKWVCSGDIPVELVHDNESDQASLHREPVLPAGLSAGRQHGGKEHVAGSPKVSRLPSSNSSSSSNSNSRQEQQQQLQRTLDKVQRFYRGTQAWEEGREGETAVPDFDQLELEDQSGPSRDLATTCKNKKTCRIKHCKCNSASVEVRRRQLASVSVRQVARNSELPFVPRTHQLEGLRPTLDDLAGGESRGAAASHGAVKDGSIHKFASVVTNARGIGKWMWVFDVA